MEKNLIFQTIRPLPPRLEYLLDYGKKWYYGTNLQAIGFLVIVWIRFEQLGVYSKSVTKTLYGKFLVSETIFKLVCHCESCSCSVKKGALKNFENFTGKHCVGVWGPTTFLKRYSNTGVFPVKFAKFLRKMYLLASCIFKGNFIYNAWKRYS